MCKLIGFISFWIAVGMLLMLLITHKVVGLILIMLFLLLGYCLFCN